MKMNSRQNTPVRNLGSHEISCRHRILMYLNKSSSTLLRPEFILVLLVIIALSLILWQQVLYIFLGTTPKYTDKPYVVSSVANIPERLSDYKYILNWAACFGRVGCGWDKSTYYFRDIGCPESRCIVLTDRKLISMAEIVVFHVRGMRFNGFTLDVPDYHDPEQIWVYFTHENPYNTYPGVQVLSWLFNPTIMDGMYNASMSYMRESDFFMPYFTYIYRRTPLEPNDVIPGEERPKLVLWFVSNCESQSNRLEYALEMKKHIDVDIFGKCGAPDPCKNQDKQCVDNLIKQYKFYLAFENARCRDYITEKFWRTLDSYSVPIVLGADVADYKALAPPHSFIHVDEFESPQKLTDYLKYLDANVVEYNKYLQWTKEFEIIGGSDNDDVKRHPHEPLLNPMCKMCAMAHNKTSFKRKTVQVSEWFSVGRLCHDN